MTDDQAWEAERTNAVRAYQVAWNMFERASLADRGHLGWRVRQLWSRVVAEQQEDGALRAAYNRVFAQINQT